MKGFSATHAMTIVLAGAVVAGSLGLLLRFPEPASEEGIGFWEASARGLVSVAMVQETYQRGNDMVTQAVGIRVDNGAGVPVVLSEEAVLMSPHPSESPAPDPRNTTQDAVLTVRTIPTGGSALFSYGDEVLQGYLSDPVWWCSEENQETKADVRFHVGGETLPFALRPILANRHREGPESNTQWDFWVYLRSHPTVVVGKDPLWTRVYAGSAGQVIPATLRATNLAVYSYQDAFAADVNVTRGVIEDDVPAGWGVQEGSYSVTPDEIVAHPDGSRTLRWRVNLPAALVDGVSPTTPTPYGSVTRSYRLVAPSLPVGRIELPRARSDMDADGAADAHSAPSVIGTIPLPGYPVADAGGPYAGGEGDTVLLNASGSYDPGGKPLEYRWDFTADGTYDTAWSPDPTAHARFTDDFRGTARVEVSNGNHTATAEAAVTIENLPPEILDLHATLRVNVTLRLAGEKWHDARLVVAGAGEDLAEARVVRSPGNPDEQAESTGWVELDASEPLSARVEYAPMDDPVNGRPNGDNPATVSVAVEDGPKIAWFHNFNVRHPATWTWDLEDFQARLLREGVTVTAHVRDPGSDDLTALWNLPDGGTETQVFYNNGETPDPPQSQGGVSPFLVAATVVAHPVGTGDVVVRLRVTDDDGGTAEGSLTFRLA